MSEREKPKTAELSMWDFMMNNPYFITHTGGGTGIMSFAGGPMEEDKNYQPHTRKSKLWDDNNQADVLDMIKLRNEWMKAGSPYINQDEDIRRAYYTQGLQPSSEPSIGNTLFPLHSLLGSLVTNQPTAIDTAHVYPGATDDLIAELSHGYDSENTTRSLFADSWKGHFDNWLYGGHDNTYDKPGTTEHTAHQIVEPQIRERLGPNSIWNLGYNEGSLE